MSGILPLEPTLSAMPPPWDGDALASVRQGLAQSREKVVVLDDDPTGTQTVENISVVTSWDLSTLRDAFEAADHGFFILTNSRALNEAESIAVHEDIIRNLDTVASGVSYTLISRSDSTLRGHYLAETRTIARKHGPIDIVVVAPFFEAGGRLTLNDIHYVAQDGELVPAHLTPFAKDKAFGYGTSRLPDWVEEKTRGATKAEDVVCISLNTIRREGPSGVLAALRAAPSGSTCIVNACVQQDMEVFVAAALEMEQSGRRILYRTAASLVAARLGMRPPTPLARESISRKGERGGLVVVGSYVPKSTEQLKELLKLESIHRVELDVEQLLSSRNSAEVVAALARRVEHLLAQGKDTVLFTSRNLVFRETAEENLALGEIVAKALVDIVAAMEAAPGFVIAKGGITSSTIATEALRIRKATILGQIIPGVPVWRSESGSRFRELDLVVFPGNVGDKGSLAEAYLKLRSGRTS